MGENGKSCRAFLVFYSCAGVRLFCAAVCAPSEKGTSSHLRGRRGRMHGAPSCPAYCGHRGASGAWAGRLSTSTAYRHALEVRPRHQPGRHGTQNNETLQARRGCYWKMHHFLQTRDDLLRSGGLTQLPQRGMHRPEMKWVFRCQNLSGPLCGLLPRE